VIAGSRRTHRSRTPLRHRRQSPSALRTIARTIGTIGHVGGCVVFQDMFGLITFDAKFAQLAAIPPRASARNQVSPLPRGVYQFGSGLQELEARRHAEHGRWPASAEDVAGAGHLGLPVRRLPGAVLGRARAPQTPRTTCSSSSSTPPSHSSCRRFTAGWIEGFRRGGPDRIIARHVARLAENARGAHARVAGRGRAHGQGGGTSTSCVSAWTNVTDRELR